MSTTAQGRGRSGGFLRRQRRQLVGARFRRGEKMIVGHNEDTLAGYLRSGRISRFFERCFALLISVVFLIGALAGFWAALSGAAAGWSAALAVGFGLVMGWLGVRHLAGWRCMRRHRRARREAR